MAGQNKPHLAYLDIPKRQGSCNCSEIAARIEAAGRPLDWTILDPGDELERLRIRSVIIGIPWQELVALERRGYWRVTLAWTEPPIYGSCRVGKSCPEESKP